MENRILLMNIIKELNIKSRFLYEAFNEVKIKQWKAKQIINGHISFSDWDANLFESVFFRAIDLQSKAIEKSPVPNRYRKTLNSSAKYKEMRRKKAEVFKAESQSLFKEMSYHAKQLTLCDNIASLGPLPDFKRYYEIDELYKRALAVKPEFDKLNAEHSYIISQNIEAFTILSSPTVLRFYAFLLQMSEPKKQALEQSLLQTNATMTIGEIIALPNSTEIQQWSRIKNSQYQKSFSVQLSRELKKQENSNSDNSWKAAYQVIRNNAWDTFLKALYKKDYLSTDVPMSIVQNAKILDCPIDMELIFAFLCYPAQQEEILKKLQAET